MRNPQNPKERNLLKGAIRRTFSRSELRRKILDASVIRDYSDPSRKRVTRWSKCPECKQMIPTYLFEVDHIDPVIPIGMTLEEMNWDQVIDAVWCDEKNLKAICKECHKEKTKIEQKERRKKRETK